jgi:hypothetical protein
MTTFTTKILAAVAVMALTFGSLQAGEKKGGKSSSHSGPSKPIVFDKSDHKKNDKGDFKYDKHDFKYDKHDFHFKWYPPCYPIPGFCWFPTPCYPWWPYCPPSYPYASKPIDPGIGNGYPMMKSYK